MPDYISELQRQINAKQTIKIDEIIDCKIELFLLDANLDRNFFILTTSGLAAYELPISDKENNAKHIELCFALPSYWDTTFKSENALWVVEKLKFLCNFLIDKKTHFWDGHTIPNSNPNKPFSETMKQEYLLFSHTFLFPDKLSQIQVEDKNIHLLFLIPIFQKELEHKLSRGTMALKKKMLNSNASEILDDFRLVWIKKRFGLF